MKRIFLLLLILLFLPLNAEAFGINKTMRAIMRSWVGESIGSVINYWGYPDYEKTIAGRKLYYWDWSYYVKNPTYTDARANTYGNTVHINATTYGGGSRIVYCNRVLETDSEGTITSWNWSGNNCPYTKVRLYKQWVNPQVLSEEAYEKNFDKQYKKVNRVNTTPVNEAKYNRTVELTGKFIEGLKENQNK